MTLALAEMTVNQLPGLVLIGLALFFGTVGAGLFQRFRIPQVVGYIVIGLILGRSGLSVLGRETLNGLEPFNVFALGVIGFLIGGELHRDVFRKYGRQFFTLLFAEGLGAFILVSVLVSGVAMLVTGDIMKSLSLGLVLGAISSATAPAATVNVLWEYKTRGPLTSAVFAIVAMDDALALVLYSMAVSVASLLMGQGTGGPGEAILAIVIELLGAVALGLLAGLTLDFALRRTRDHENSLVFILGMLGLVVGLGQLLKVDTILSAMTLGLVISNRAPRRTNQAFTIVEKFTPPIFCLFFVSVGAQIHLGGMAGWMWALVIPYVLGRTAGKLLGANLGGRWAHATSSVRKYLGLCLFSQAGVAVGLSIMASHRFSGDLGDAIVTIIAMTTFVVQIIGPPCVKLAVRKAGEIGLNVTEEDLISSHTVADVMDHQCPSFDEHTPLAKLLSTISSTHSTAYPVLDRQGKLSGVVTLQSLKQSFAAKGLTSWLVACDLMQPVPDSVTQRTPLQEAMARMKEQGLEYLPVVAEAENRQFVGMLERQSISRRLSQEILDRRRLVDDEASQTVEPVASGELNSGSDQTHPKATGSA